ncbi:helix-turn-helix transcriptional regulator [bacterium]|nr:helix-turn-helix transcriptional regulator [bacterium]
MNLKQEMGQRIKRIRKQKGLTQEQLAEIMDISSRNLSNIELGNSFPKPETLERFLKKMDITTQTLFSNDSVKSDEELIKGINFLINSIKNDHEALERTYRILNDLVGEL